MKFIDFLKDKVGLLIFNFSFLIFISLVIIFSPLQQIYFDTILYIFLTNLIFLSLYLSISYYKKNRFLNSLKEDINVSRLTQTDLFKLTNEEKLYIDYLKNFQQQWEDSVNEIQSKSQTNSEIMDMWVHDIKIPISILKLIIERNEDPSCEELLDKMDNEIMRIENSVERVLYLSRLEDFHNDFLIHEVQIEKLLREVIRRYSKYFISKKIKFTLENVNYTCLSDKKWLLFIFDQLINNALKYTETGGSISITGVKNSTSIIITIRDTGCGIKKEDLNRIFNKGFTGNNGRNNTKSTGLGLYLVKELCAKLEHHIHVTSLYNEHTEFNIVLKNNI
ncbi:sensor histidine kinase [Clostridium tunisiense]|uniref:sensor histidine kinase n=1 Tax=Clostridium tunisiense TaxID=219748 RepID=UPI00031848A4|nr:sensor histidine kinase [Clostridium tunisiense]